MFFLNKPIFDDQDFLGFTIYEETGSSGAVCGGSAPFQEFTVYDEVGNSGAVCGGLVETMKFIAGNSGAKCGGSAKVSQVISCKRTFPLVYPERSRFDVKAKGRRPAYLASITVCQQGLETVI